MMMTTGDRSQPSIPSQKALPSFFLDYFFLGSMVLMPEIYGYFTLKKNSFARILTQSDLVVI